MGKVRSPGDRPHTDLLIGDSYALQLEAERTPKARALPGHRFRFSSANGCARALGYEALNVEPTDPPGAPDLWRMDIGSWGHLVLQKAFLDRYFPDRTAYVPPTEDEGEWGLPDCVFEAECEIPGYGTGHADIWCPHGIPGTDTEGIPLVAEIKHANGTGYKMAIGVMGAADGPKHEAKIQGALCAKALGAELVVIVNVATEIISHQAAAKGGVPGPLRAFAEWRLTRDEWEPLAEQEMRRVARILSIVDAGELPPRAIFEPDKPNKPGSGVPVGARVVDPAHGTWVLSHGETVTQTGNTWKCVYCNHRSRCIEDGA